MLAYTIINPSDDIIMDAPDHRSATAACVLIGDGRYALEPRDGSDAPPVPLMFLGDPTPWFKEKHGVSPEQFFEEVRRDSARTVEALRSVRLADGATQTSLNDIVGRAREWAHRLEQMQTPP